MAKTHHLLLAHVSLCLLLCNSVKAQEDQNCITRTAASQLHVREATGRNDGPEIDKYLLPLGLPRGSSYCAAGTAWTLDQCQVPHTMSGRAITCCPTDSFLIFSENTRQQPTTVPPGSRFFWFRTGGGHTSIIEEWPAHGPYFTAINFNGTTPDGRQGVARRQFQKKHVQRIYARVTPATLAHTPTHTPDTLTHTPTHTPETLAPTHTPTAPTPHHTPNLTLALALFIFIHLWRS